MFTAGADLSMPARTYNAIFSLSRTLMPREVLLIVNESYKINFHIDSLGEAGDSLSKSSACGEGRCQTGKIVGLANLLHLCSGMFRASRNLKDLCELSLVAFHPSFCEEGMQKQPSDRSSGVSSVISKFCSQLHVEPSFKFIYSWDIKWHAALINLNAEKCCHHYE